MAIARTARASAATALAAGIPKDAPMFIATAEEHEAAAARMQNEENEERGR